MVCQIAEDPRSVFPWTPTDCVQVLSTPLPSTSLSQWRSSRGTWLKAPTGESIMSRINKSPEEWLSCPAHPFLSPLQGSQCRCRPPSSVPAPAASAALSPLPDLPKAAPLSQEHVICPSGTLRYFVLVQNCIITSSVLSQVTVNNT